jgi:hypothetical protein
MQGAESSEHCNKNELIPALPLKTSGSRNHYRRISHVEQHVRINQPRPGARELEEGAGRMSALRQQRPAVPDLIAVGPRRNRAI